MKVRDFLISNLERISNKIEGIQFIYNFHEETNSHIIFVSPSKFRTNDDLYIDLEYDLWKAIFRDYPNEDVLITDNNEYEIHNDSTIIISNRQQYFECKINVTDLGFNFEHEINFEFNINNSKEQNNNREEFSSINKADSQNYLLAA